MTPTETPASTTEALREALTSALNGCTGPKYQADGHHVVMLTRSLVDTVSVLEAACRNALAPTAASASGDLRAILDELDPHELADNYEFRSDGDYTTTDFEKTLLEDFAAELLGKIELALARPTAPDTAPPAAAGEVEALTERDRKTLAWVANWLRSIDEMSAAKTVEKAVNYVRTHVLTKAEGQASRAGAGSDRESVRDALVAYVQHTETTNGLFRDGGFDAIDWRRRDEIIDAILALRPDSAPGVGEAVEALKLADSFDLSGATLIHPEQYPPGYEQGWKEAHTHCAKDLRALAALAARTGTGWQGIQADEDRIAAWVLDRFGAASLNNPMERADRLLEEAIKMQQAVYSYHTTEPGLPRAEALLAHVYSKEPGNPQQEMGGVMTCALALGRRLGVRLDTAAQTELTRIEGLSKAHFDKRHQAKVDAGVAAQHERPAAPPSPTSEGV